MYAISKLTHCYYYYSHFSNVPNKVGQIILKTHFNSESMRSTLQIFSDHSPLLTIKTQTLHVHICLPFFLFTHDSPSPT